MLCDILTDYSQSPASFPFNHIIIDEGQDFGQERMNASFMFMTMEKIISKKDNGSFILY